MSKAARYLVSAIVILILAFGSMAMAPAARSNASVHLKSGSFVPVQGPSAAASQKYYIVQFAGPVQQAWKDAVTAEGAELLEYIPDFAFKVRMNPAIAQRVGRLGSVSEVVPFQAQFKFGKDVKQDDATNVYIIRIERGSNFAQVRSLVARTGAQVLGAEDDLLIVAANDASLNAIAAVDDVASINNFQLNETNSKLNGPSSNDTSADIIGALVANSRGYDGSTQIVAVSDTGIGGGTTTTAHPDIPGSRVVAVFNWPGAPGGCFQTVTDDGSVDVDSGHGTHTASSILSAGEPSGQGRGIAPAAQLVFQSTENWATITALCQVVGGYPPNGYFLTGLPSNLGTLYQQAYNAGARIHSNSWGAAVAGDYTVNSVNTDAFIWNNRDMVITFSAGNEGTDANANGVVDNDSIGSPATSKNVITIGASENQRTDSYPCDTSLTYTSHDAYQTGQTCNTMGGTQSSFLGTYGQRWGADFPANPIASDVSAGNSQQMAAFSSRGPTDDTRIKPDVVAPGTWILSGFSSLYQEGYGDPVNPQNGVNQWDGWGMPYNGEYKYMGGTSMSNPIAAGGATVIKDYYNKAHSINATAALVKATIINSAVDMLDENNDGANDNDFPIPNVHEGWGRVNLDGATDGTIQFVDEGTGLSTGGSANFQVTSTGGPLKVTVVWSDFPSTDTAAINLVNDLDVTVSGPSGTFRGNVFSGGWSITGGSADRRNNVENVYIQNAAAGTYTVTISGFNVPQGPQKFALVVDGGSLGTGPTPTTGPTNTPTNTPTVGPTNTTGPTNTGVPTNTATPTRTPKNRPTSTRTPTGLPTNTLTPSSTPINTPTFTSTPIHTQTPTNTPGSSSSTGPLGPASQAAVTTNAGDNNGFESNPTNAFNNDSVFAVDSNSGSNKTLSCTNVGKDKHDFYDYSINLPGTAAIQGIEVQLDARADATAGTPSICIQLSWDGGATWTTPKQTTTLTTSEVTYTLGSPSDTWGRTWAVGNFSNANFRVRVINVAGNAARDFFLDYLTVNVTYIP